MGTSNANLFGLTRAQRMAEEDEEAGRMYGVPRPLCVPRVLPPAPPYRKRTWEETLEEDAQVRAAWLEMKRQTAPDPLGLRPQ